MNMKKSSRREEWAQFRLGVIGDLLHRDIEHGELEDELKAKAKERYRPPGADSTRTYHYKTLQRWFYNARKRGPRALQAKDRRQGHARALDDEQRELLLDVRREHRSASAELILAEAVRNGVVDKDQVSVVTLRRLYRDHDLTRTSNKRASRRKLRRRWRAARVGAVWHADVCHVRLRTLTGEILWARVHGILDDASRYLVGLEARKLEREEDLLAVLCGSLLRHPPMSVFYVDNGSCYRGDVLATAAQRLGIRLVHAQPYDPEARGKMERLWRTMRQQCTDHLGAVRDLGEVNSALWAWRDRYHRRPHAGLMGQTPRRVYLDGITDLGAPMTPRDLARALEVTVTRRVRKDGTLSVKGRLFEVAGRHLVGKSVDVVLDPLTGGVIRAVHGDREVPVGPCDPVANRSRPRPPQQDERPSRSDLPFDPIAGLLAAARKEDPDE